MSKITYTSPSGRSSIEFEFSGAFDSKEVFSNIGNFQEIMSYEKCGKCGSENLRFVVRKVDKYTYYEIRCMDCGAKLEFGVVQDTEQLYPKRKNEDGSWRPDNGWVKWNSQTNSVE